MIASYKEYNTKYETVRGSERTRALLTEFGDHLTKDLIPKSAEGEKAAIRAVELFGMPTTGFQPTAEMRSVLLYLRFAADVFNERQGEPGKVR